MEYDWAGLKQKIVDYAYLIGIKKIGFTNAEPLYEHLPALTERIQSGFEYIIQEGDPHKRINPKMHMCDAKSVISIALPYAVQEHEPEQDVKEQIRGRLSHISRGRDYHHVVRDKLELLVQYIKKAAPVPVEAIAMVDTGELLEKAIAVRAGLGWMGKNTLLITPEYGSYVSLGEIICNLPLPEDIPSCFKGCGSCTRCLNACPTGALNQAGKLNPDLCLAGLTQTKKTIPVHLRKAMGNLIYGCDGCQQVCPHNFKKVADPESMLSTIDESHPLLEKLLKMSNREFGTCYGHTAGAWRGRTVWQRNALIAAGNLKAEALTPVIRDMLLRDPRTEIRKAAAWSLGQISGVEAEKALLEALGAEKDEQVLEEIRSSLQ